MTEPLLNAPNFSRLLKELEDAFGLRPLEDRVVAAYWKRLKDVREDVFREVVEIIISTDHKFPTIARILEVCKEVVAQKKKKCTKCGSDKWTAMTGELCIDCYFKGLYGQKK